mgnify:CR=1 FL=1
MQLLLENVVKHNKVSEEHRKICATITIDKDWLTIKNNRSKAYVNQESLGTGLENLKSRYELLSDRKVQISGRESSFTVMIPIINLSYE